MRTGPTNLSLKNLIIELNNLSRKENVKIWGKIAEELNRATRQRREVNINRINRATKENETVVVPGKVLSEGELEHKMNVAAWKFSEKAKEKINKKGKAISIKELIKENPKGKRVRIIG